MNWDDLRYCLAVVREGSVTAAAARIGVSHTTVSRRITELERELNAPLFDRSTTGWLLTPVGESILASAEQMHESVLAIQRQVQVDRQELSGRLRVTAHDTTIQRLLLPGLKAFAARYPDITIELIASEESLDLGSHEADIAFRATDNPPPNVLGTRIAQFAHAVYVTPELYARYLENPRDIGGITWMGDGRTIPEWITKGFPGMQVRYRINSLNIAYEMTRAGMGFLLMPCALGDMARELIRVPTFPAQPALGFWLLSHIDMRTTARIRIFRDFMLDSIRPYIPLLEGKCERAWETIGVDPTNPAVGR